MIFDRFGLPGVEDLMNTADQNRPFLVSFGFPPTMASMALLLFSLVFSLASFGKGGWNGSGGGGIACFKDSLTAGRAFNSQGHLRDKAIGEIQSLNTVEVQSMVDHWVHVRKLKIDDQILIPSEKDIPQEFAQSIIKDRMQTHQPTAAFNMLSAMEKLAVKNWKPNSKLKVIRDFGPAVRPPSHCRYVQMAVRYSKPHPADELPEVQIEFDPRLISRMQELQTKSMHNLNMTSLLLHETIAYLTYDFQRTDNNSLNAQNLTIILLSKNFWEHMSAPNANQSRASFTKLIQALRLNRSFGKAMNEYL